MRHDLTLCLITCGEPTESRCLAAVRPHRHAFVLQEVRHVYPQIAALKQMVAHVRTPFLVPLDADMILYPDALPRIRAAIDKHQNDPTWHSILFRLYDTLTERPILALKILRSEALHRVPFEESATPDISHFRRLTAAGYRCIDEYLSEPPIGDHVVEGPHFCYHKYRDVYQTLRVHGYEWDPGVFMGGKTLDERAQAHYNFFLAKYLLTDNEDYLHCIGGMADGLMEPILNVSKSLQLQDLPTNPLDRFTRWYLPREMARAQLAML